MIRRILAAPFRALAWLMWLLFLAFAYLYTFFQAMAVFIERPGTERVEAEVELTTRAKP